MSGLGSPPDVEGLDRTETPAEGNVNDKRFFIFGGEPPTRVWFADRESFCKSLLFLSIP